MNRLVIKLSGILDFVKGFTTAWDSSQKDLLVVEYDGRYYQVQITEIEDVSYCHPKVKEMVQKIINYNDIG